MSRVKMTRRKMLTGHAVYLHSEPHGSVTLELIYDPRSSNSLFSKSAHKSAESINWLILFVSRTVLGLRFSEPRNA
jgi:hypothetical protein